MYETRVHWKFGGTLGGRLTPAVKGLMVVTVAVFLIQLTLEKFFEIDLSLYLGLVPQTVIKKFYVWQLFTYLFLHGNLIHLLFNMLVLWMLGGEIEEKVFWAKGFLKYYFGCGIGAACFNLLFSFRSEVPIIGSSGAIYGILAAYAVFFGNRPLILFPFPVFIRAKYFVLMIGLIELISSIFYTTDGVAHIAHLGGLIIGFIYIYFKIKGPPIQKPKFRVIKGGFEH